MPHMIARTILVSLTIGGGTAAPVASKTLGDPQAPHNFIRGFCYISECAPGPDRASWCGPTNEFVQSDFCQSSESDCLACNLDKPFVWNDSKCYGGTYQKCAATCPFVTKSKKGRAICKGKCGINCLLSKAEVKLVAEPAAGVVAAAVPKPSSATDHDWSPIMGTDFAYDPDFVRGSCYISECAPGPDRAAWCDPTNEFVQSDVCQSSESDCLACNPDKPFVWNDSRCYGGTFDSCAATCPFKFDILSLQLLCKAICVPNCLLSPLDMVVVLTVDDGKEQLARELFDSPGRAPSYARTGSD